jgi:hypothetical protein
MDGVGWAGTALILVGGLAQLVVVVLVVLACLRLVGGLAKRVTRGERPKDG